MIRAWVLKGCLLTRFVRMAVWLLRLGSVWAVVAFKEFAQVFADRKRSPYPGPEPALSELFIHNSGLWKGKITASEPQLQSLRGCLISQFWMTGKVWNSGKSPNLSRHHDSVCEQGCWRSGECSVKHLCHLGTAQDTLVHLPFGRWFTWLGTSSSPAHYESGHRFIEVLLREKFTSEKKARQLLGWTHSGFSLDAGEKPVAAHDVYERRRLAEHLLRAPFSLEKVTWNKTSPKVLCRSKRNWHTEKNFQIFEVTPTAAGPPPSSTSRRRVSRRCATMVSTRTSAGA